MLAYLHFYNKPTESMIYSCITDLLNAYLAGDTMANNVKFMPLWNLYSSEVDGNWTKDFSLILSLQVCDVFHGLTPIMYSHPLGLHVLEVNFFRALWVIPTVLTVCLSNSSNDFASSKFPLLSPFWLMMFGTVYISCTKLAHQVLVSGLHKLYKNNLHPVSCSGLV